MFKLGKRSRARLKGVHPDLVKVIERAIELTPIDFTVLEGLRTEKTQARYLKLGRTKTMNSRHLTGHAVDIAPLIKGQIPWSNLKAFATVADAVFQAANELGVVIQWGGDWDCDGSWRDESFFDGPHFQIPWPYRLECARKGMEKRQMTGAVADRSVSVPSTAKLEDDPPCDPEEPEET